MAKVEPHFELILDLRVRCSAVIPGVGRCESTLGEHDRDGNGRPIHRRGAVSWNGIATWDEFGALYECNGALVQVHKGPPPVGAVQIDSVADYWRTFGGVGPFTQTGSGVRLIGVPICPDLLDWSAFGVADNWRGRVVRAFFWLMRLWPT